MDRDGILGGLTYNRSVFITNTQPEHEVGGLMMMMMMRRSWMIMMMMESYENFRASRGAPLWG